MGGCVYANIFMDRTHTHYSHIVWCGGTSFRDGEINWNLFYFSYTCILYTHTHIQTHKVMGSHHIAQIAHAAAELIINICSVNVPVCICLCTPPRCAPLTPFILKHQHKHVCTDARLLFCCRLVCNYFLPLTFAPDQFYSTYRKFVLFVLLFLFLYIYDLCCNV